MLWVQPPVWAAVLHLRQLSRNAGQGSELLNPLAYMCLVLMYTAFVLGVSAT